jgi:PAS domain S-box-containing protein
MSSSRLQPVFLHDSRLAPLATSALPVWLWSADATRIVWANAIGAAVFGAPTSAAIAVRRFDAGEAAAEQIARLAATLSPGAPPRLERLRGFGAGVGGALTCACSRIALADASSAILVVAAEPAGPDLSLEERVHRLIAGSDAPVAAFSTDGRLIAAAESVRPHLRGASSLTALGAETLAAEARASGHAAGRIDGGEVPRAGSSEVSIDVSIDRIGGQGATVLIASFGPPHVVQEAALGTQTATALPEPAAPAAEPSPQAEPTAATAPPPPDPMPPPVPDMPAERRHPLRFVWQMDETGRFTLGSDEFIALVGARTAAAVGQPWREIGPSVDPEGQIARAIATRDTWSGLTVLWSVDDGPERLAVELSGLPVFDRERVYRGYRGFGVCRDLARLTALARRRPDAPAIAGAFASAASAGEPAASAPTTPAETSAGENIVPFPSAAGEPNAPALSAVDRSAFRELSRKLSQRLTAAGIEHAGNTIPAGEDQPPIDEVQPADTPAEATSIFDKMSVGILIYRLDQLLYANPAFLQWTGHQSLAALIAAGGLDGLFIKPIGAATAGGESLLTLSIDRGARASVEGELIDIHWGGEPAQALVTSTQLTREPGKLEPARAELAELQSIIDTATDGVILLDARGRIASANHSAEALFGYEQLAGLAFADLFAPESVATVQSYLDGFTRARGTGLLDGGREVIGRVRQGGAIPLFMTMGRIEGRTDKLCAVFRDITLWKKAEAELTQAKRRAEQASSAKSDFLARLSHEIRTPLNAIIGFSEVMMAERFGPVGNERYREYLRDIHTSGGHLLSLINDLLDLSKIEAGKLELTFTSVALNDLTQQCVAIMQPQANRERIIIRTSLLQSLPQVVADARSVRQIVLNLLSNSIKFTGAGGQVIVSTALNDNGEVVLRVRDTGIGMSDQDLVTALEPFRQLATSARARSAGTGLGLPLTKALAEANRAGFQITSAPKEGTLVEIAFPATRVLAG